MTDRDPSPEVVPADSFDHLVYRGGFLMVPSDHGRVPDAISHWTSVEVGDRRVLHDPAVSSACRHGASGSILVVGNVLDPYESVRGVGDIAEHLASAGRDGLLDALDQLSGRYVIVGADHTGTWVLTDSSASRSLAHVVAGGRTFASSHATLLGEMLGLPKSAVSRDVLRAARGVSSSRVIHLPGMLTAIEGVRSLSPNHRLWMRDASIERVFPRRRRRRSLRTASVIDETAHVLRRTMDLLAEGSDMRISLTAGLDSRTTFAAARGCLDRVETFSYINTEEPNSVHLADVGIATELSRRAGVEHHLVDLGETERNPASTSFRAAWLRNLGVARGLEKLNREFARSWPHGVIHVRSNVAEVVQAFYRTQVGDPPNPAELAERWHPLGAHPDAVAAIREMLEVYGLVARRIRGYDIRDLFYWEHRLPQWYAWLCLESDMSQDTFCPFGNRRLLARILSLPRRAQADKVAFTGSIERLWPELLDLPVNPKTWPSP